MQDIRESRGNLAIMEHTTFERTVPEGYSLTYHIDAADKKTGGLLTLGSLVIAAAVLFVIFRNASLISLNIDKMISYDLALLGSLLIYIVLHELTHGAVYKALTHEKLKFGITWSAAFCGVPEIFTYRSTAIRSLIAPFTLFSLILIPLTVWLHSIDTGWYLVSGILLALHLSGCIGDLYMLMLFLTKYKDPDTLMRDTGPEQWIYTK